MHNEHQVLSLMVYALDMKGVSRTLYYIGNIGDEAKLNDVLCLMKEKPDLWLIFYTERGQKSLLSSHLDLMEAANYFFWRLTRKDTIWDFRQEWEDSQKKLD